MCIYASLLVCVRIGSFDTGTYHFIRKHYNQVRTYFYMLYRNIHTYVVIYIKSIYAQHTHKHTYTRHTEKTQIQKKHKYTHTHIQKVHAHKKQTHTYKYKYSREYTLMHARARTPQTH